MTTTTRPRGFSDDPSIIAAVRVVPVASPPLAADPSSLTDANYQVTPATVGLGMDPVNPANGGVINCGRLKSLRLGLENADGTAMSAGQTIDVEPLVFDRFGPTDGHWKRMKDAVGNPIGVTIPVDGFVEMPVIGRVIFLRISAVGATPITGAFHILAFAGDYYTA